MPSNQQKANELAKRMAKNKSMRERVKALKDREDERILNEKLHNENVAMIADVVDVSTKLELIYDVESRTHDGYCSDPSNFVIHRTKVKKSVGLPKVLVNDVQTQQISLDNPTLCRLFTVSPEWGCGNGSGWCGCKTTYTLESAVVVNNI